jgi:hypothetical protein
MSEMQIGASKVRYMHYLVRMFPDYYHKLEFLNIKLIRDIQNCTQISHKNAIVFFYHRASCYKSIDKNQLVGEETKKI